MYIICGELQKPCDEFKNILWSISSKDRNICNLIGQEQEDL